MTAFETGAPPAERTAPDAAPAYLVRTVRPAVLRRFWLVVAVLGASALLVVAVLLTLAHVLDGAMGALAMSPFLVTLLGVVVQLVIWAYAFGARAAISVPLTLTADGPVFALPQGTVAVPWAAVTELRMRSLIAGRVLRFRLHPAVTVDAPGVSTTLSPRALARQLRCGLTIGSVGIDHDLDEVVLLAEQLAGRPLRTR